MFKISLLIDQNQLVNHARAILETGFICFDIKSLVRVRVRVKVRVRVRVNYKHLMLSEIRTRFLATFSAESGFVVS